MFDFTEPRAIDPCAAPAPPKTSDMACASTTSPTAVDVPCPSMSVAVAGESPEASQARSMARRWPMMLGAVMPLPRPSLAPATPRMTA